MPLPGAIAIVALAVPPGWALGLAGAVTAGAGELLRAWGVAHIGRASRTRSAEVVPLVDTGPFAWSRNPLYVGNLCLWLGVGLLAGRPLLALGNALVLAVHYHFVIGWEESNLRTQLGAPYEQYLLRVRRWLGPRAAVERVPGRWGEAMRSERSTFVAIAVLALAIAVRVYVFGR